MEQLKRGYNLFTAIAMIVGIVIGSGIFFKSDDMLLYTSGNVGLAVLVFCIAAFTIVFGCLTFSQLAAFTDKPGGVITYANEFLGKTSGAYSFGSYDSMPYILLNYNNKLKDVFTIAHEMGHSMHSYYTRHNQPFVYGGHSIFTAEVASTVNESLLMQHLLSVCKDPEEKKYLLNLHIEEFRTTLFRQTMFAEFEKLTHEAVEKGEVLTAEWLCEEYVKLNRKYYGEKVVHDPQIKMEWARIPHFYRAFYVYKYATGFSAATFISSKILNEGQKARDAYIEFLKSGESDYPIELLKIAGVDMSKPEPIVQAMDTFEKLVVSLEELM
jgi:oligoendopeptidase F